MPSKLSKNLQREGRVSLPAPIQPLNTRAPTDLRHDVTFAPAVRRVFNKASERAAQAFYDGIVGAKSGSGRVDRD